ncbi:hypothetical protein C8Q69DRAFT_234987 [Paecilomyces variotii]|uniref:Uncharacterized protein n=1 Tax=Byssochlamys spectabilis TaxID=264951 RepID=A0A443HWN4_BYSSP|nr:hypothetical protein C8Q69DRAFT_234987 [Paecilomyces variotii]RWQ96170.1 hypothetical protein C8Q69DRAFT_234987 [Paecilomyces variotii]
MAFFEGSLTRIAWKNQFPYVIALVILVSLVLRPNRIPGWFVLCVMLQLQVELVLMCWLGSFSLQITNISPSGLPRSVVFVFITFRDLCSFCPLGITKMAHNHHCHHLSSSLGILLKNSQESK